MPEINAAIEETAAGLGLSVHIEQSNHEGQLVDVIHERRQWADGIIINPAAYTHTSVALGDALRAVNCPAVEVHLSNIASREEFRQRSMTAGACVGQISGFGPDSYILALQAMARIFEQEE
ncbi:MAG: type II 3-dehydroquinate dehydratase [Armatimonadota bacterium]